MLLAWVPLVSLILDLVQLCCFHLVQIICVKSESEGQATLAHLDPDGQSYVD